MKVSSPIGYKELDLHARQRAAVIAAASIAAIRHEAHVVVHEYLLSQKRLLEKRADDLSYDWRALKADGTTTQTLEEYVHGRCLALILPTGRLQGTGLRALFAEQLLYSTENFIFRLVRTGDRMTVDIYEP